MLSTTRLRSVECYIVMFILLVAMHNHVSAVKRPPTLFIRNTVTNVYYGLIAEYHTPYYLPSTKPTQRPLLQS